MQVSHLGPLADVGDDGKLFEDEPTVGLSHPDVVEAREEVVEVLRGRDTNSNSKVERAGEVEALHDAIIGGDEPDESVAIAIGIEPDVDRCLHWSAECGMVQLGSKGGDNAAISEPLHASSRSIWAEPDGSPKFAVGQPSVALERTEYFAVNIVDHSERHRI